MCTALIEIQFCLFASKHPAKTSPMLFDRFGIDHY